MSKLQNRGRVAVQGGGGGGGTGEVKVTVADTTLGFLQTKIIAGTDISLVLLNAGGNEQLQISAVAGGGALNVLETGANVTAADITNADLDIIKSTAAGAITVDLPALASFDKNLVIFAGGAGAVTVDGNGAEQIDGSNTLVITSGSSFTIHPFSSEWNTI